MVSVSKLPNENWNERNRINNSKIEKDGKNENVNDLAYFGMSDSKRMINMERINT